MAKCAGNPLALRVVAALMEGNNQEKDWEDMVHKNLCTITEKDDNVIFQLIKLSFDQLPHLLKKCFIFCSLFQKDNFINKTMLIRLWFAEGFVSNDEDAEQYLTTLLHRSFFQNVHRDVHGNIIGFKMHDLMHEFSTTMSNNMFVQIGLSQPTNINQGTRHVSFVEPSFKHYWEPPSVLLEAEKLKTFLIPNLDVESYFDYPSIELVISTFKKIRVLTLIGMRTTRLPSCIGELVHTRYLDISDSPCLEILPDSITKLYNLETFLINRCEFFGKWPDKMWKFTKLKHLEFMDCPFCTCIPPGLGKLTTLQTVMPFHSAGASELAHLDNLTDVLSVSSMECLRSRPKEVKGMQLQAKSRLNHLELIWSTGENSKASERDGPVLVNISLHQNTKTLLIKGFSGSTISSKVTLFSNLDELCLRFCERLQHLPASVLNVKSLRLESLDCLEEIVNDNVDSGNSPSLQEISLRKLPNFKGFRGFGQNTLANKQFERLDCLYIEECPKLFSIPKQTKLRKVEVTNMRQKTVTKILNSSEVDILVINKMVDLKSISSVIQNITTVTQLHLHNCSSFDPCQDDVGSWQQLKSLKVLELYCIPNMQSIPDGIQHLPMLEKLIIQTCKNLKSVKPWVKSLQEVIITGCPYVKGSNMYPHHSS